jgi:hypothetical protein
MLGSIAPKRPAIMLSPNSEENPLRWLFMRATEGRVSSARKKRPAGEGGSLLPIHASAGALRKGYADLMTTAAELSPIAAAPCIQS